MRGVGVYRADGLDAAGSGVVGGDAFVEVEGGEGCSGLLIWLREDRDGGIITGGTVSWQVSLTGLRRSLPRCFDCKSEQASSRCSGTVDTRSQSRVWTRSSPAKPHRLVFWLS